MPVNEIHTYRGGPLDGQIAKPTAARGKQFTIYRTADGLVLPTNLGDAYGSREMSGRKHPGYYSHGYNTSLGDGYDTHTRMVHYSYKWNPPRTEHAPDPWQD